MHFYPLGNSTISQMNLAETTTGGPGGPPVVLVVHTCRYQTYTRRRPFGNRPIHFVGAANYTPCGLSVSRGGPRRLARQAISCPTPTNTIPVRLAQAFLWSVINSSSTRAAPRRRPRPTPASSRKWSSGTQILAEHGRHFGPVESVPFARACAAKREPRPSSLSYMHRQSLLY